jgi:gliding motility-associated-like protein
MPLSEMTTHLISETSIAPASSLPMITTPKTAPIQTITNVETKHQAQVIKQSKVSEPTSVPQESELKFVLPNVFTPNGDGSNDELSIEFPALSEFSLAVLDTKGTAVFRTQNPDFKWNGEGMDGQKVPPGDYVYFITAKDAKGKTVSKVCASSTAINIETSNFTPGVYFVTVSGLNGTQKLVIE